MLERKTKGRLYSVGGNEPLIRKGYRGRLDRLKTVGTFDLGTEISVLSEVAKNLNEKLITGDMGVKICGSPGGGIDVGELSSLIKYPTTSSITPTTLSMQSTSARNTPESCKKQLNKSISSIRTVSDGRGVVFRHRTPISSGAKSVSRTGVCGGPGGVGVQTQHSADDCIQRKFYFRPERKSRSLSTSGFLSREKTGEWSISLQQQYHQHQQQQQQQVMFDDRIRRQQKHQSSISSQFDRAATEDGVTTSSSLSTTVQAGVPSTTTATKTVEFSKSATETSGMSGTSEDKSDKKEFSYMKRKSMLRKSKRIVRTDSEIFREGIISSAGPDEKNIMVLQNNSDIQIHTKSTADSVEEQHREQEQQKQQPHQQLSTRPPPHTIRSMISSSQEYTDRNSSVTSSSVFSRKNSSDFEDLCSPREYHHYRQSTTTDESSKNQSADELDAVFSDSTADLEQLEKEYKELMKSNLQREYKSDGDTLDEIGKKKKREDLCNWKNQSLEHDFGVVITTHDVTVPTPTTALCTASTTTTMVTTVLQSSSHDGNLQYSTIASSDINIAKDLSRIYSPESYAASAHSDSGVVKSVVGTVESSGVDNLDVRALNGTNMRVRVYSSSRVGETPTERERLSYPLSVHQYHHYRGRDSSDDGDIEMMSPSKSQHSYQHSQSISMYSDSEAGEEILRLQKTVSRPSILKIDHHASKQQQHQKSIESQETGSEHDSGVAKCSSIFDNPLSKFKKVNKLLKCKRFSSSALYDKKSTTETSVLSDATTKIVSSTISTPTSTITTATKTTKKGSETSKTDENIIKPLKKKRAIHLSKLSLFSQKQRKQSGISRSDHELTSKSSTKAKLSETSKSTCEISISKLKSSPLRFSRKSSKREKQSKSLDQQQQKHVPTCHSPLSEEFYNKTGSVRLSAIELYEKFCSEDFGGLYKHETDDPRIPFGSGQHEYRLEKKGLRTIGRYNKNAKLLKQRSEPKFHYLSSSHTAADTFYHEEEEYYYDSHPEDEYYYTGGHYRGPYYNEQDEYYDEYEDEEDDVDGFDGDYYEDEDDRDEHEICYSDERPTTVLGAIDISGFREVDDDEDEDDRDIIAGGAIGIGIPSSSMLTGRYTDIMDAKRSAETATDSDVDEILLMPSEGSKCSGSDYEEYGFENKQFTLEQTILKTTLGATSTDTVSGTTMRERAGHQRAGSYDDSGKNTDDVLTIYKICSRDLIDKNLGAFKEVLYSSNGSLQNQRLVESQELVKKGQRLKDDLSVSEDDLEEEVADTASNKKYRSLSLQCGESLQKAVSDYVKLSTTSSDQHISPPRLPSTPVSEKLVPEKTKVVKQIVPASSTSAITTIATLKTDCLDVSDKTDHGSLELLSTNSSSGGTIRSHSTLTEYAFDTVKNLNMDSCSTNSKLSLSLKSEIFDDFTITPDDLKPVMNKCDFEDFTLTPDGSVSDEKQFKIESILYGEEKHDNEGDNTEKKDDNDQNYKLPISPPPPLPSLTDDNELDDKNVLLIVNEFLANERNLPKFDDIERIDTTRKENENQKTDKPTTIHDDLVLDEIRNKQIRETELLSDTDKSKLVDSSKITTSSSSSSNSHTKGTTGDEAEDHEYNEEEMSLFTSELTKEFDRLFSNAEKLNETSSSSVADEQEEKLQQTCSRPDDNHDVVDYSVDDDDKNFKKSSSDNLSQKTLISKSKTTKTDNNDDDDDEDSITKLRTVSELPSRYSMQKLEPLEFFDDSIKCHDSDNKHKSFKSRKKLVSSTSSTPAAIITTPPSIPGTTTTSSSSRHSSSHSSSTKKLQKQNRSQSLGNLNKKTKCFPL